MIPRGSWDRSEERYGGYGDRSGGGTALPRMNFLRAVGAVSRPRWCDASRSFAIRGIPWRWRRPDPVGVDFCALAALFGQEADDDLKIGIVFRHQALLP